MAKKNVIRMEDRTPVLSADDKDHLSQLKESGALSSVLKLIDFYVRQREADLVSFQYGPGKEQELQIKKAKAQGARECYGALARYLLS